jgi:sarcosine oxidase
MPERFDVVVVGAGAVGSAAAYHAAKSGRRTLLLEQFELGHNRGSSHGESRIIRHSYSSVDYATLAPAAFEIWRQLERESGAQLLTMTGGVDLGPADNAALLACREALGAAGFGHAWLEGEEARSYLPQFDLPADWAVLFQSGAGILHAGRCVRALAGQAIAFGATLLEDATVQAVEGGVRATTVTFERGGEVATVEARSVIIAAGPWAGRWLERLEIGLPVEVTQQQVVYYPVEDEALWAAARTPIYIAHGPNGFYGFPVCERPGFIKVGIELAAAVADPDVPCETPLADPLAELNRIVAERLRGVRPEPAEAVTCRYTETPNRDFVIDRHPEQPGVVIASPCSGHGFKFAVTSGKLAMELALEGELAYSSVLWRERFALVPRGPAPAPLAKEWRG